MRESMDVMRDRFERSERGERTFVPDGSAVEQSAASPYPALNRPLTAPGAKFAHREIVLIGGTGMICPS
jgi:hypothetical protein